MEAIRSNAKIIQSMFAEMLCTFIFGFAVYSAVLNTKYEAGPTELISIGIAIAFSSVALIYTFKDHTIAHFNPAITLAAILTLKLDPINGIGYIIMQFIGFILAALLTVACFPGGYSDVLNQIRINYDPDSFVSSVNIFFSEFTLTAILAFVAFENAINNQRNPEKSFYGDEELEDRGIINPLVIGLTLGFLSLLAVTTSGSTFNPGFIFAPMILTNNWPYSWQYYVSQFTGGLLGALIQVWLVFK